MSIRITTHSDAGNSVVRIAGRLEATDLDELTKVVRADQVPEVVDLSDLRSADAEGAQLLRELVSLGAQICGASPYIELLMNERDL